jgi:hypothetical protein
MSLKSSIHYKPFLVWLAHTAPVRLCNDIREYHVKAVPLSGSDVNEDL